LSFERASVVGVLSVVGRRPSSRLPV